MPEGPDTTEVGGFRTFFSRSSPPSPSGEDYKDPATSVARIGGEEKEEGSDAERSRALGPDAGLLSIPYPSIVELRRAEFSESSSRRPREREDSDVLGRTGRSARARARAHESARDRSKCVTERASFLSLVSRFDQAERSVSLTARILRNAPLMGYLSLPPSLPSFFFLSLSLFLLSSSSYIIRAASPVCTAVSGSGSSSIGGSLPRAIRYLTFSTSGLSHNLYA